MSDRDAVITGIGLVSSVGEGADVHWTRLAAGDAAPVVDETSFAPYPVHPLPEIDWSLQIPKRGDLRQMETWQKLGTYTAGLALDDCGMKDDAELCASMDMIVAAAGGERDLEVDSAILAESESRNDRDVLLNEKLTTELRPTLFLAQLSNLLAGNISIVHKVTGSSRTFMGEEGSGVSAIDTAAARIRSGQSSHLLVGAAFQCEHDAMLFNYELGGYLHRVPWKPLWQRDAASGGGVVPGSGAAFLVLESRAHAEARGARIYAAIGRVAGGCARRTDADRLRDAIRTMAEETAPQAADSPLMVISGASGAHLPTGAEREAFAGLPQARLRGFSNLTGHLKEAQLPFAVALGALSVHNKACYPPFEPDTETALEGAPRAVLATAIGYYRSEGMTLVTEA